ncbi:MAG: AmmeMemoRadiSam system protein B [Nitrospirota bacterium]
MKKLFSLLILLLFSAVFTGCGKEYIYIDSLYPEDEAMWKHIFDKGESIEFETAPMGIILPHHSITQFTVNSFYAGLAKVKDPSVVVVLGPNHFESGLETGKSDNVQTCNACIYSTTDGDLMLDEDFIDDMVDDGVAVYNDTTFAQEHAVFAHSPFIKHYFPEATIVPILFKWDTSIDELKEVSDFLDENLPADALVLASVDFSHYVPDGMALFHDDASYASITNFDYSNIFDLELDSPSSIYTLLSLMDARGYMNSELKKHTNLTDFIDEHKEETTSHLYFAFYKGEVDPYQGVSILVVGSLPDDNTLEFMTSWKWDENYDEASDQTINKQLRDIRGTEDRFLVGADYYLFDHVENECSVEEQNYMKIAFCKFSEDEGAEKEYLDIIDKIKEDVDEVVLLFDYQGGGEVDEDRKFFTRALAKKGVDIFIGRGLKEIVPFETYKGNLLFHNLGNFIVDNKLVTDLNALSSGIALGLHITPYNYIIYTFPVSITNGYPTLEDYSKRTTLFNIYKEDAILDRHDSTNQDKGFINVER